MDTYLRPCRDGDRVHCFVRLARMSARHGREELRCERPDIAEEAFEEARSWLWQAREEKMIVCTWCKANAKVYYGHLVHQCVRKKLAHDAEMAREEAAQVYMF